MGGQSSGRGGDGCSGPRQSSVSGRSDTVACSTISGGNRRSVEKTRPKLGDGCAGVRPNSEGSGSRRDESDSGSRHWADEEDGGGDAHSGDQVAKQVRLETAKDKGAPRQSPVRLVTATEEELWEAFSRSVLDKKPLEEILQAAGEVLDFKQRLAGAPVVTLSASEDDTVLTLGVLRRELRAKLGSQLEAAAVTLSASDDDTVVTLGLLRRELRAELGSQPEAAAVTLSTSEDDTVLTLGLLRELLAELG